MRDIVTRDIITRDIAMRDIVTRDIITRDIVERDIVTHRSCEDVVDTEDVDVLDARLAQAFEQPRLVQRWIDAAVAVGTGGHRRRRLEHYLAVERD